MTARRRDPAASRALVIGIGNADRGDDAAGLQVAARIRAAAPPGVAVMAQDGDPVALIDAWAEAPVVYLVDALASGGPPGRIYRFDAAQPLDSRLRHHGTHGFGVADAIELARALGRLPPRLVGYGIEGRSFAIGTRLSPQGRRAAGVVAARLLDELAAVTAAGTPAPARPPAARRAPTGGRPDR